jgi:hypothetical protein
MGAGGREGESIGRTHRLKAAKAGREKAKQAAVPGAPDCLRCILATAATCLAATLVVVWLAAGCGLDPCGAHGECSGVFVAECTCTGGFSGDACQYAEEYSVRGCATEQHCGDYNRTSSSCDGAPVYQLGGPDGPVLYRHTGRLTNWALGPSKRRGDCAAIPALSSSRSQLGLGTVFVRSQYKSEYDQVATASGTGDPTEEPPSSPLFEGEFGGWRDFEAPLGSQLGTVTVHDSR